MTCELGPFTGGAAACESTADTRVQLTRAGEQEPHGGYWLCRAHADAALKQSIIRAGAPAGEIVTLVYL